MLCVGIVVWLSALLADVVHDFVFALSGNVGVGQDDLDVAPSRIVVQSVVNVVLQTATEALHEWSAWCDAVGVEVFAFGLFRWENGSLRLEFFTDT